MYKWLVIAVLVGIVVYTLHQYVKTGYPQTFGWKFSLFAVGGISMGISLWMFPFVEHQQSRFAMATVGGLFAGFILAWLTPIKLRSAIPPKNESS